MRIARLLLALGLFLACGGCARGWAIADPETPRERVAVSDGWLAMGTFFEADLRVAPGREAQAREWLVAARGELARLEAIYSRHDPESEVSRLNRSLSGDAGPGDDVQIGPELEAILAVALEVFAATGGAFDPTVGPLLEVWQAAVASGEWPDLETLRLAKARVGAERIVLSGDGSIHGTAHGLRLDLDGLAKGVALDRLRASLETALPEVSALLSLGESSVVALGDPDGRRVGGGWRLEVHSRDDEAMRLATILLRDRALSVSSSVGRFGRVDGERVSHVVDPRTGTAVAEAVEAVVVAERAGLADAWSTALLVLGAERAALRLVERSGLEAYVFESSGRIAATDDWEQYEAPPAR